jgi:hypothetical protein
MSQQELLKRVVNVLTSAGIDYMITGSVASSLQGEPRASHDIDLVILLRPEAVTRLLADFPAPEFFLSEQAIRDAIRHKSMFNLLQVNEGDKVDFWLLTDEPFDQSRFARRRAEEVFGAALNVSAPEDTILAKLRWCQLAGGSEKQFKDALRIYEVQGSKLDIDYLRTWARQLGVDDLWQRLQAEAKAP